MRAWRQHRATMSSSRRAALFRAGLWTVTSGLLLVCTFPAGATAGQATKTILFLGDSLTAGYGLLPEESFPSLIGRRLKERDLPFEVINAGVPGDTSAGGLRRIDWMLRRRVDILVLELGANDMLRGLPLDMTRDNLQAIIDKTRAAYPDVKIVVTGMLAPPNLGPEYTTEFREIFPALAEANDAALIPFLLQDVAARPELNLPDGIHPNVAGQQIVADGVWLVLQPLVTALVGGSSSTLSTVVDAVRVPAAAISAPPGAVSIGAR